MIKANELRIKNIVLYKGDIYQWTREDYAELRNGILDNTNPIPLTEELSLKFNPHVKQVMHEFASEKAHIIINWLIGTMEITVDNGDDEWDSIYLPIPEFVHLFQNLWFALTGKELIIK